MVVLEDRLLFVVSVLSTSLLGAYLCFHIERTARGNFILRLALSDQVGSCQCVWPAAPQMGRVTIAYAASIQAEAARDETILAQLELETQQQEAQEALEVCVRACVAYDCCATGVSHASARGTSD